MPLSVVAPTPWFPILRPLKSSGSADDPAFTSFCALEPSRRPDSVYRQDQVKAEATVEVQVKDEAEEPPVCRPRMFYLPGVLKVLDAAFYARSLRQGLRQALGGAKPDLIDAHFEWPDGVGAYHVAREIGAAFVCTLRGKLVSQAAIPAKRRRIREMLLGADALIAVSQSLADLANEIAGRDLSVRVIPNGIDPTVFRRFAMNADETAALRAELGWEPNARYVVSVGHLQALKGFHRLVEVWPAVRRRAGDVRLILVGGPAGEPGYERRLGTMIRQLGLGGGEAVGGRVYASKSRTRSSGGSREAAGWPVRASDYRTCPRGGGDEAAGFRARASKSRTRPVDVGGETGECRTSGSVTVLGRVPPTGVARLLSAADVFALASRSEGWCNAIAEALACGCPVVATDVGGNGELICDAALGRLTPLGDREALAGAVCEALAARWDRDRIAHAGGRRDWRQVAGECVDVFMSAMRRRTHR